MVVTFLAVADLASTRWPSLFTAPVIAVRP